MISFITPHIASLSLLISTYFYGAYFLLTFLFPRLAPNHQKRTGRLYFSLACFILPLLLYPLQYVLDFVPFFVCMLLVISIYLFFSFDVLNGVEKAHPAHQVVSICFLLLYTYNLLPSIIYTLLVFFSTLPTLESPPYINIIAFGLPFVWLLLLLILHSQVSKLLHPSHASLPPTIFPSQ
jgi:hypothetical protein